MRLAALLFCVAASGLAQSNTSNAAGVVADKSTGTPGTAVPGSATYIGGNAAGNLAGLTICNASAQLQMATATTTQIVALAASQKIRVCGYAIQGSTSATATTLKLVYGTGTACATGTTQITPAWNMPVSSVAMPMAHGSGIGELFSTATGNALCATSSAAGTVNIFLTYSQY